MKSIIFYAIIGLSVIACNNRYADFKVKHIYQIDKTVNFVIKIDYPVFKSPDLMEFNQSIQKSIDSNIIEFKKFILDFEGVSVRSLNYSFEIKSIDERYVSVAQTFSWAVPGVERILYQYSNMNYDRLEKRFINADLFFKKDSGYIDSLRVIANEILKQNAFPLVDSAEVFDNFYFSNDTVFFNLLLNDQTQYDYYTLAIERNKIKGLLK